MEFIKGNRIKQKLNEIRYNFLFSQKINQKIDFKSLKQFSKVKTEKAKSNKRILTPTFETCFVLEIKESLNIYSKQVAICFFTFIVRITNPRGTKRGGIDKDG